jgi:hypothetical protein
MGMNMMEQIACAMGVILVTVAYYYIFIGTKLIIRCATETRDFVYWIAAFAIVCISIMMLIPLYEIFKVVWG